MFYGSHRTRTCFIKVSLPTRFGCKIWRGASLNLSSRIDCRKFRTISQITFSKIPSNKYLMYHLMKTDFSYFQKDVMWQERVQPKKRMQPATTTDERLQTTVPTTLPRWVIYSRWCNCCSSRPFLSRPFLSRPFFPRPFSRRFFRAVFSRPFPAACAFFCEIIRVTYEWHTSDILVLYREFCPNFYFLTSFLEEKGLNNT